MDENRCRLCNRPLGEPLLTYANMPDSAQGFLTEKESDDDRKSEFHVCQCQECGLVQIPGKPVAYYKDVIRATEVSEEMKDFRRGQFSGWIERYGLKGKKIIEIGCGRGEYMNIMAEQPVELYGMEHNPESVKTALKNGLRVVEGYPEEPDDVSNQGFFDGFYVLNFLEHVPEPKRFLHSIYNGLTAQGVGIVEVPNFNMILEKKLFSEFIRDHLMYFTKQTLRILLECSGFEVLEIREVWYDYILSAVVRKRPPIGIDDLQNQKQMITEQLWEYVKAVKEKGGTLAVWGAGHQALAILSMTEIYKEVSCVIDSAEFKQNKYTPATHIKILPPRILMHGNITDVLIIAGGFSDEILRIMDKDYPNVRHAILRDDGVELC